MNFAGNSSPNKAESEAENFLPPWTLAVFGILLIAAVIWFITQKKTTFKNRTKKMEKKSLSSKEKLTNPPTHTHELTQYKIFSTSWSKTQQKFHQS